jgi:hypothetical protein
MHALRRHRLVQPSGFVSLGVGGKDGLPTKEQWASEVSLLVRGISSAVWLSGFGGRHPAVTWGSVHPVP